MNSLDKMEEEKMRESFSAWFKKEHAPYTVHDFDSSHIETMYIGWKAANSQHSKVLEDYDRLAKLCEKQAMEIEALQYRLQTEFDRGMEAARKDVQTVEVGENSPDNLEDWIGDKPIMRIQFYSDSGDMSVGIWPTSGWEVSADQIGTVLEELISSLSAANATISMLRDVLKDCQQGELFGISDALSNTQASADAFLAEHDAKVLEEAAELLGGLSGTMLRQRAANIRASANRKDE